jgi:hypothetical protein
MSDLNQSQQIDEPFDLEREPLDKPLQPFEIDWGGDGFDLERPVRAHVLAALQPSTGSYEPPLDALLHQQKNKRKTASASRKANRKKRK